jgi:hypothetical protein
MSACVFLGPTLAHTDAARIIDATFCRPVKLGDVFRVVSRLRPRAIGIVDGYFQWVPAVWHKEILWAIGEGVHVFGSASMGALRAAELAPFGMHGVGRIFEAYRIGRFDGPDDDPFEDDDEVAVMHGSSDDGYLGIAEAMVNIRCTLARAGEEGVISEATRRALVGKAKTAFFPNRRYSLLLAQGRAGGLPERELAALERWLPSGRVDQKRLDAVAMLEAMRNFLAGDPPPARADFALERTVFWERAEAIWKRAETGLRAAAEAPVTTLLAALRVNVAECEHRGEDELRDWYFAKVAGTRVPADLDEWIHDAGYTDRDEFHRDVFATYLQQALGGGP